MREHVKHKNFSSLVSSHHLLVCHIHIDSSDAAITQAYSALSQLFLANLGYLMKLDEAFFCSNESQHVLSTHLLSLVERVLLCQLKRAEVNERETGGEVHERYSLDYGSLDVVSDVDVLES